MTAVTGAAIEAAGLARSFGDVKAVDGVDLSIAKGAVFGLVGPDGAGKSTLIRMLATVLTPGAGDAAIEGFSVRRQPGKVTPLIGYMSQKFSLYPDLTVAENIEFFAKLRGVPADVRGRVARPARAGCHRRREGQSGQRVRVHPTVPHRHPPPAL